jgi:anaerobic magnesium-protoporphyrin IX monomethyl ester cyclase
MDINVILVYPPQRVYDGYGQDKTWFPLGIASIAANAGHKDTVCLDLFYESEDAAFDIISENLSADKVNLVGFTMMTEQRHVVLDLCSKLKNSFRLRNYTLKTIVGGPHPSIMYTQLLENYKEYIDHVIIGEGEKVFRGLVEAYKEDKIPNLLLTGERSDIDTLIPVFDGLKYFKPKITAIDQAPIILSRGCTHNCTFCSTNKVWGGYRTRKAFDVMQEIQNYINKFKVKYFKFHDDSATASAEIMRLCAMLRNKQIKFEITARPDQLNAELISFLAAAGCVKIALGLETGDDELRCSMGKKYDMVKVAENIAILKRYGIKVHGLLIVGYPGENEGTINKTCEMLRTLKLDSWSKLPGLMVVPGTPVYNKLKRQKWIDDAYWLEDKPCPYYTGENSMSQLLTWGAKINSACEVNKILVAGVINEDEKVFKEYLRCLDAQFLEPGIEVDKYFILHNAEKLAKYITTGNYKIINNGLNHDKTHTWTIEKFNFIAQQKNSIVSYALAKNYTHIFWVDSDIIIPDDLLTHLIRLKQNIVSAVFWTKWPGAEKEMPNCWDTDFYSFGSDTEELRKPNTYYVGGTGACILVNTAVYKRGAHYGPLRSVSWSIWEDRAFCIRAEALGFTVAADSQKKIKHLYTKALVDEYFNTEVKNNGK